MFRFQVHGNILIGDRVGACPLEQAIDEENVVPTAGKVHRSLCSRTKRQHPPSATWADMQRIHRNSKEERGLLAWPVNVASKVR